MLKIYHNPRCTKSRQALQRLQAAGVELEVIEYLKDPPSAAELDRLLRRLDMQPQQLMRRKESEFKQLELDQRKLNRKQAIKILVEHPKLIERPIIDDGERAVIGRPTERIDELLD